MDKKTLNSLFLALNLISSVITMSLVLIVITRIVGKDYNNASLFIGFALITQVIHQVLVFCIYKAKSDKFRAILIGAIYVASAIFAFIARTNYNLFYTSTILLIIAVVANQFLSINKNKSKRECLTNILLGVTLLGLGVAIIITAGEEESIDISLVAALILLCISVRRILMPSLRYEKMKLLLNILIKTHTFDALICLVAFIIAFSFMLPMVEESITGFWDAMWYCFTVVTTIGFGDFAATSAVGRVLTVILGIYGIVVVAILTSVIVNYYNEISAKEKDKKAKDYID